MSPRWGPAGGTGGALLSLAQMWGRSSGEAAEPVPGTVLSTFFQLSTACAAPAE